MNKTKTLVLQNLVFVLVTGSLAFIFYNILPDPTISEYHEDIDDVTKQSLALVNDMNKYLTTVAFAIVGVLGSIMIGKVKTGHQENIFTSIVFFLAIILAGASIYFGYAIYSRVFEIVSYHMMNVHEANLEISQNWQFGTLLGAAFLFSWYIYNVFISSITKKIVKP